MKYFSLISLFVLAVLAGVIYYMPQNTLKAFKPTIKNQEFLVGGIKYQNGSEIRILYKINESKLLFDTDNDGAFDDLEVPLYPLEVN